jgi:Heterokaryon incompatibility protein (HET)
MPDEEIGDPAASFITARPCDTNLGSAVSFAQARSLLETCLRHDNCTPPARKFVPSRVVDTDNETGPRLRTTRAGEDMFEYLALSYVWGMEQTYVTTNDTIGDKSDHLDMSQLPKTILDAIEVTQRLGFRFLWVDSLCIVQDSKEDKRREISQMRLIFRHATLTIAAGKASTVADGFLTEPDPQWFMAPFKIPFRCPDSRNGTVSVGCKSYYNRGKDPLNSRAWTFEEELLSPRVLQYSYDGLRWLCNTQRLANRDLPGPPQLGLLVSASERTTEEPDRDEHEDLRTLWCDILGEYTQRNLTHAEDKLVAFAAVAEAFHEKWGDEYLAGLWRRNLFEDLLWHRDHTSDFQEYLTLKPRPTSPRAPSWSWAAIDGYVFGPRGSGVERKPFEFRILDCGVQLVSDLLVFGPVTEGDLRIEGRLRTAYFHSADPAVDFCDGYVNKQATPTADGDLLAEVSVDAVEPSLVDGASVFCLPLAKYHDSQGRELLEGLILLAMSERCYRRVGFFSECDDLDWFASSELQIVNIL